MPQDNQGNEEKASQSRQSPVHSSVSPNSLLGSRENQPHKPALLILLSPVKDQREEQRRGERERERAGENREREKEGKSETLSMLRKKVNTLTALWSIWGHYIQANYF